MQGSGLAGGRTRWSWGTFSVPLCRGLCSHAAGWDLSEPRGSGKCVCPIAVGEQSNRSVFSRDQE